VTPTTRTTAPTTATTGVTRRLGREERRASIVAAAARAFSVGGFTATSMADIATASGVSHLIVYRHFESKEAIYEAVLDRALVHLDAVLAAGDASGKYGPTPAALLAAARADVDAFRVLWRHAAREPDFARQVDAARRRVSALTTAALEPLVAPEHLCWATKATVAYVVDAVLIWIEDGEARLDDRFVAATDASLRAGVRSWAEPPRSGRGT
jgi:AcrR family transcriptional regulator